MIIQNPLRLPDGTETLPRAGDEFAWDPNTHMVEITRRADDGSRMNIHVTQADGTMVTASLLGAGIAADRCDERSATHIRITITFILEMLKLPLKPVLMPQRDDRYVFRLE